MWTEEELKEICMLSGTSFEHLLLIFRKKMSAESSREIVAFVSESDLSNYEIKVVNETKAEMEIIEKPRSTKLLPRFQPRLPRKPAPPMECGK
jgi:hypothetical protein